MIWIRGENSCFLFHAYTFLRMSSISHKELDPIESLKGVPQAPIQTPIGEKITIFAPFAKFLKFCSVTFFITRIQLPWDVLYQP